MRFHGQPAERKTQPGAVCRHVVRIAVTRYKGPEDTLLFGGRNGRAAVTHGHNRHGVFLATGQFNGAAARAVLYRIPEQVGHDAGKDMLIHGCLLGFRTRQAQ